MRIASAILFLFCGLWSLNRWQRFQVYRHCKAVFRRQFFGIENDRGHGTLDGIEAPYSAFQEIGDLLDRPILQSGLGDVGDGPFALGIRATSKTLALDDGAEEIAR